MPMMQISQFLIVFTTEKIYAWFVILKIQKVMSSLIYINKTEMQGQHKDMRQRDSLKWWFTEVKNSLTLSTKNRNIENNVIEFLMQVINKINRKMCQLRHAFKCYIIKIHCDKDGCQKMLWPTERSWKISNEVEIDRKINLAYSAQWAEYNIHHFTCYIMKYKYNFFWYLLM